MRFFDAAISDLKTPASPAANQSGRIAKRLQAFKTRAAICGASCAPGM